MLKIIKSIENKKSIFGIFLFTEENANVVKVIKDVDYFNSLDIFDSK